MTGTRPLLQVIIASTRPGRLGEHVGRWTAARAEAHDAFDIETVDLAEVDLPMFAEPRHPKLGQYELESTRAFARTIDRAAAFVIVLPEYNHSFNAAIKNALDHLSAEWRGKPVGLLSYGGVAAGARAATALEPVLLAVGMIPLAWTPIPFAHQFVDTSGEQPKFRPNSEVENGTDAMLDTLTNYLHR